MWASISPTRFWRLTAIDIISFPNHHAGFMKLRPVHASHESHRLSWNSGLDLIDKIDLYQMPTQTEHR
jgi:hypothetical protein